MARFQLSDETLNSYGFRVLTSGIDLTVFEQNPVMLHQHNSYTGMPIGRWTDLKKANGVLSAETDFDEEDPEVLPIKGKVDRGYLKAASVGIRILAWSDDPKDLLPGQTRPTVTRCQLYEASIVGVPANANALKLRDAGGLVTLSADAPAEFLNHVLPSLKPPTPTIPQVDKPQLCAALGLSADASDAEVIAAIGKLKAAPPAAAPAAPVTAPKEELAAKETPLEVQALLALGEAHGVVNDANRATYAALAASNPAETLALLKAKPVAAATPAAATPTAAPTLAEALAQFAAQNGSTQKTTEPKKTYHELERTPEGQKQLAKLRREDPAAFEKLFNESYTKV